jgi:penicillin amidase
MGRIQGDTFVGQAPGIVARLRDAAPTQADGSVVLQRIRDWDGLCTVDSAGCAAFWAFEYRLARALFDPRLGAGTAPDDIARLFVGTGRSAEAALDLLGRPDSRWWDDPATAAVETQQAVVSAALDAAGADLRSTLGDPARWTWGALHTITFREPTLGASGVGPLEAAFNRGPYACPGAPFAVNQNAFDVSRAYADPYTGDPGRGVDVIFTVSAGPSYRLAVDMGDLDGARIIITTGQSGIPFDSHYDDMIGPWLRDETVPLPFTRSAVERAAANRLILEP